MNAPLSANPPGSFWSAVFLTAGTMVGVGLLAVPVLLGLAGFWPGATALIGVALLVWSSGFLLAERSMDRRMADADLVSLYRADLGNWARWVTLPAYLLLFYVLLIAYLTGAADTLAGLLPWSVSRPLLSVLVFCGGTSLFLFGRAALLRFNGVIVLLMVGAFVLLLAVSIGRIDPAHLSNHRWAVVPFTLPVLCCAFAYHNIIPLVCADQQWNRRRVHGALSVGLLLAVAMTLLWFFVVTGSLPRTSAQGPSLLSAYADGSPATVPLAQLLHSHWVTGSGLVFSLLAILTSYVGVGASLMSFLGDALPSLRSPRRRPLLLPLTFVPPLLLALWKPGLFLHMVDIAGGMGMILLFGVMPTLAFLRRRAWGHAPQTFGLSVLLVLFLAVFAIEAGKELGVLRMNPERGMVLEPPEPTDAHSLDWLYELEEKMIDPEEKERP